MESVLSMRWGPVVSPRVWFFTFVRVVRPCFFFFILNPVPIYEFSLTFGSSFGNCERFPFFRPLDSTHSSPVCTDAPPFPPKFPTLAFGLRARLLGGTHTSFSIATPLIFFFHFPVNPKFWPPSRLPSWIDFFFPTAFWLLFSWLFSSTLYHSFFFQPPNPVAF